VLASIHEQSALRSPHNAVGSECFARQVARPLTPRTLWTAVHFGRRSAGAPPKSASHTEAGPSATADLCPQTRTELEILNALRPQARAALERGAGDGARAGPGAPPAQALSPRALPPSLGADATTEYTEVDRGGCWKLTGNGARAAPDASEAPRGGGGGGGSARLRAGRLALPGEGPQEQWVGAASSGELLALQAPAPPMCPVSTGRGTRRVRIVRGEGRIVSG
jgi:hypothetical protein